MESPGADEAACGCRATTAFERSPDDAAIRSELSIAYVQLGDAFSRTGGQFVSTGEWYARALAIDQDLGRARPHDSAARDNLVWSYLHLSDLAVSQGRPEEASALADRLVECTARWSLWTPSTRIAARAHDGALAPVRPGCAVAARGRGVAGSGGIPINREGASGWHRPTADTCTSTRRTASRRASDRSHGSGSTRPEHAWTRPPPGSPNLRPVSPKHGGRFGSKLHPILPRATRAGGGQSESHFGTHQSPAGSRGKSSTLMPRIREP